MSYEINIDAPFFYELSLKIPGTIAKLMWYEPSLKGTSGHVAWEWPRNYILPTFSLRKTKDKQKSF